MQLKVNENTFVTGIGASLNYQETTLCPAGTFTIPSDTFWKMQEMHGDAFLGKELIYLMYKNANMCAGYIDSYRSGEAATTIAFRGAASLAVDGYLSLGYQQKKNVPLLGIIEDIASSIGLKVNNSAGVASGVILSNFTYETGVKVFEVLDKITNENDIIITSDANGNLQLNARKLPTSKKEFSNVVSMQYVKDQKSIFGEYTCIVCVEDDSGKVKTSEATVKETEANPNKKWIKKICRQGEGVTPQNVVNHEKRIRRLQAEKATVQCASIFHHGEIISVGEKPLLPFQHIAKEFSVASINYAWNVEGETATYELVGSSVDDLNKNRSSAEFVEVAKNM